MSLCAFFSEFIGFIDYAAQLYVENLLGFVWFFVVVAILKHYVYSQVFLDNLTKLSRVNILIEMKGRQGGNRWRFSMEVEHF